MGNSPNHFEFIKMCSRNGCTFILWLHMCCLKKTYRKFKIFHPSSVRFGYNRPRIQPGSGSSLISWKRPRMCFVRFPLPMRNALSSSVFHSERASYISAWIENFLCGSYSGTDKLLLLSPLNIQPSLVSRSSPRKCCKLLTAVSGCFCSLLCLIWKRQP